MRSYSVKVPIHITYAKNKKGINKKIALNLNWYRNAHYFILNNVKVAFKELLIPQLTDVPNLKKIKLHYTLYTSKRKSDVMNWVSVIDKFFQDALVEFTIIDDDNYETVSEIVSVWGGYDPDPHIIITIEEIS